MTVVGDPVEELYARAATAFERWEIVKDVIDETIDLTLNYRQSGHPGGSRSKVHLLLSLMLSGAMRWDLLRPWRPFADRFVLSAGHTVPLVYCTLAVLNEVMRARHERDPRDEFAFPDDGRWALTYEDLPGLRHRGGLPGHAEMEGKTLFLKFNTGPSGHGMPPAAGEAVALKLAGAEEVKVFVVEGEGGLTPGASHETRNTAWGLGLSNLVFLVDWNDYGIDDPAISDVVPGTPESWFKAYDWRVTGTLEGSEWPSVTQSVLEAARGDNPHKRPSMAWFRTRKGRGYGKYDNKSHGSPHAMNSEPFWTVRKAFMEKYGVEYAGVDEPAPADIAAQQDQARANLAVAMSVLRGTPGLVEAIGDRLVEVAASVPDHVGGFNLKDDGAIFSDRRITDYRSYPASVWKQPGDKAPNRAALATWGSWVNSFARAEYGRPLVIACSADLAESTNIAGFAKDFEGLKGWGWYNRDTNPRGTLLPQEITEFTNAGLMVGLATVNLADDPMRSFNGFWGACSTYGSFSYLKYGPMRLFSQLAQDTELKVGKVLWIAGHSGPETAEDSRTHFGVFSPGVTQLFPEGHVIDLHPWEYNEVPVVLGAALALDVPIVALHLTRPAVDIPDREALGMAPHWDAARGAYVLRQPVAGQPVAGTVYVQGTVTTANLVKVLPELDRRGLNVRVVAALSPQLFARQDAAYRDEIRSEADRWDGMAITNRAFKLMRDWVDGPLAADYSLSSDWDDRWRTGGTVDEVMDEAHLSQAHILAAIERYVNDRDERHRRLRAIVDEIERR
ncbi:MAG TPA: transketolase [Candidatus Limnocylindria bacterium]|nr:transketolase [Candidatus Limnocylindria bacterium]